MLTSLTYGQKKSTTPVVNMGIGNLKLNTKLTDTIILNRDISDENRKMKELRVYKISEYKVNDYISLSNLTVTTFNGVVYGFEFDFTGTIQTMLEDLFGEDFETEEMQNFKSKNINQIIFGNFESDRVFFIDKTQAEKVKQLKYKGL